MLFSPLLEKKMSEFSTRGQRVEASCYMQMVGKPQLFVTGPHPLHRQRRMAPVTSDQTVRGTYLNSHFHCLSLRELLTCQSQGPGCLDYGF